MKWNRFLTFIYTEIKTNDSKCFPQLKKKNKTYKQQTNEINTPKIGSWYIVEPSVEKDIGRKSKP